MASLVKELEPQNGEFEPETPHELREKEFIFGVNCHFNPSVSLWVKAVYLKTIYCNTLIMCVHSKNPNKPAAELENESTGETYG